MLQFTNKLVFKKPYKWRRNLNGLSRVYFNESEL